MLLNLGRIYPKKLAFENSFNRKRLLGLASSDYQNWLSKTILPNTRLLIEPKIAGYAVALQYEKGLLTNSITNNGPEDISKMKRVEEELNEIKPDYEI